jgi:hypothetical protein
MKHLRKVCYQTLIWLFASLFLCATHLHGQNGLTPVGAYPAEQSDNSELPWHEHSLDEAVYQQTGKNSKRHQETVWQFFTSQLFMAPVAKSLGSVLPVAITGMLRLHIWHCIFVI